MRLRGISNNGNQGFTGTSDVYVDLGEMRKFDDSAVSIISDHNKNSLLLDSRTLLCFTRVCLSI